MILGKLFEKKFKEQMDNEDDVYCLRLPDPMGGFKGLSNICDFIVYKYPYLYLFELKTTAGPSLPFNNISHNQLHGLKAANEKLSVIKAGFIIWFYDKDITYFTIPQTILDLQEQGKHSIRFDYTKDVIVINGIKKKKYFEYDWKTFFKEMTKE